VTTIAAALIGPAVDALALWLAAGIFEAGEPFGAAFSVTLETDAETGAGSALHVLLIRTRVRVARVIGARFSIPAQVKPFLRIADACAGVTHLVVVYRAFAATPITPVVSTFHILALGRADHDFRRDLGLDLNNLLCGLGNLSRFRICVPGRGHIFNQPRQFAGLHVGRRVRKSVGLSRFFDCIRSGPLVLSGSVRTHRDIHA